MGRSRRALHRRGSGNGVQALRYRPSRAASVFAALFAAGLVTGFAVAETAAHAARTVSASPVVTAPNRVRVHRLVSNTPSAARTPSAAPTPSTPPDPTNSSTPGTPAPSPAVAAESVTPSPLPPCTPGDLSIVTVTAASSYPTGAVVDISTELQALDIPCQLAPVRGGRYACGTSVVVNGPTGSQVWPVPGQAEQCADPAALVLQPGYGENVTVAWNEQDLDASGYPAQAAPGQYQAFGTWSWSAGAGVQPYSVTAASTPFVVQ